MRPLTGIRYSYRSMLKTIVAYIYCKKRARIRVRIDAKELRECIRAKSENTARIRKFIYPTICIECLVPRLHVCYISRLYRVTRCFHVCILIAGYSYSFTLYHIYSSYRAGKATCSFAPFISLRLLLLPVSIGRVLASSSLNSHGK